MRANELPPVPGSVHSKKRLGRGNASGQGTYAGRGLKGQKSRSGPDLRIHFEGGQNPLVRALSRKRGFNNKFRVEYEPINVSVLNKLAPGSTVTTESLREAGIAKSRLMPVKVLGDGELSVKLTLDVDKVSAGARAKIEAAGGTATERVQSKVRVTSERASKVVAAEDEELEEARSEPAAEAPAEATEPEAKAPAPKPRRSRAKAESEGEASSEE
jgi:large subunit ribosomal protein L15